MDSEIESVLRATNARLFALQAGLMAVIRSHPHPEQLAQALNLMEEAGMSNMLYVYPDEHVAAYRNTVQQLRDQIPRQPDPSVG